MSLADLGTRLAIIMSFEDDDDFDAESVQKWKAHYSKRLRGGEIRSPSSQTTKRKSGPNHRKKRTSGRQYISYSVGDDKVSDSSLRTRPCLVPHDQMEISPSSIGTLFADTGSRHYCEFKSYGTTSTKSVDPDWIARSSDSVYKLDSVFNDDAVEFEVGCFETENPLSVDIDSRSMDSTAPSESYDSKFGSEGKLTAYSDTSLPLQCFTMEAERPNSAWESTNKSSSTLSCETHRHVEVVQFGRSEKTALSRTCSVLSAAGGSSQRTNSLPCTVISSSKQKVLHSTSKRKYEGTYPCSAPQKKQASLLSFLSSSREEVKRTGLDCPASSIRIPNSRNKSPYNGVPGQIPSPHPHVTNYPISQQRPRSCPFYKRIPGDINVVKRTIIAMIPS